MDIKAIAERFTAQHDQIMEILTKSTQKMAGLEEQISRVEQKMARGGGGYEEERPKSWGEQFVAAPELKSFADNTSRPGRFRLDVKTTMTSSSTSAGSLVAPQRDTVVRLPQRRLVVRDLLPTIGVTSGSVEYPRQVERTNNSATVLEGYLKPESAYSFDLVSTPIRTVAHWIPASRQILEDAPQLQGLIDTELLYGLALKEEAQILSGSGVAADLLGLIPQATAFVAPFTVSSPTMIDTIALAILQNSLAGFPADGIIVHPSDWMRARLLKNSQGEYILGDPASNVTPQLFGLPVVQTESQAIDKALVGNFQVAATLYDRWSPRIEVSTEHSDFFVRNLVAILCEERIGLAVRQPLAMTYVDLGNVA